jgi:putative transposase
VKRQCELLGLSRSFFYYKKKGEKAGNLVLMRRIDELFTKYPFLGYRKMTAILRREFGSVNSKRVLRLMRVMGLEAVYCKPNTSKPCIENKVYPYLLKDLAITTANQVWATDITYIRLQKGFVYLVVVMDWYSRYVISWRISGSMGVEFCLEALAEALEIGRPDIFNSDQGSQFTSNAFVGMLEAAGIVVSMDGRGSYRDNIFVERLWRTVKYEEVYLKEYTSLDEAQSHIAAYFEFYNNHRPHQALGYKTPAEVHFSMKCILRLPQKEPVDMMDNSTPEGGSELPTYPQALHQQA